MLNRRGKRIDKEQAFQKLRHYCGYQEMEGIAIRKKYFHPNEKNSRSLATERV
jgi:hypothetical protein